MKLYTEETVKFIAKAIYEHDFDPNKTPEELVDELKPIELPSDEEFEQSDYASERAFKDEIEWISNNPQCKQIEVCSNSLSKKCICPKEEQEAQQQTALEWLISKILIPISKYDEDGLFDAEPKVIGIGYQNAFRNGTELVEFVNTAREMDKEQVDSRVKDLEKRLFNCSKDNADLMAKLQNIPTYDDVRKSIESALTEDKINDAEDNVMPIEKQLFTEDDVRRAFHCGRMYQGREGDTSVEKFIEQLKQSKTLKTK